MHSLRYYSEEFKRNPKYIVLAIVFAVGIIYATASNWQYISMLYAQESQAKKILDPRRRALTEELLKREELINRFVKTYILSRNFVIVGDKSVTDLGVGLENDLRTIAEESGFEFDRLGQCRFNRISEELDVAEIQVTAKAQWADILWFMSDIEQSKPHFAWSNFSLTIDHRSGTLSLAGTLRVIVVKDATLIEVLSGLPLPEARTMDSYVEPEEEADEEEDVESDEDITLPNQTDSQMQKEGGDVKTRIIEDEDFDFEGNESEDLDVDVETVVKKSGGSNEA